MTLRDLFHKLLQIIADRQLLREKFLSDGVFWICATLFVLAIPFVAHVIRSRRPVRVLLCYPFGHNWETLAVNNRRAMNLAHLSIHAGHLQVCRRCNKVWNDTGGIAAREEDGRIVAVPLATLEQSMRQILLNEGWLAPNTETEEEEAPRPRRTAPKKKAKKAEAKPEVIRPRRSSRFDRDVFDEEPTATPGPETPGGTSSPPSPSKPEGSELT